MGKFGQITWQFTVVWTFGVVVKLHRNTTQKYNSKLRIDLSGMTVAKDGSLTSTADLCVRDVCYLYTLFALCLFNHNVCILT